MKVELYRKYELRDGSIVQMLSSGPGSKTVTGIVIERGICLKGFDTKDLQWIDFPYFNQGTTNHQLDVVKLLPIEKIKGYRELSAGEIASVNSIKEVANNLVPLFEMMEGSADVDQRWLAIAKTDLQKGFMALTRAITKPEGF